jgi:hypothetical protein
MQAGTYLIIPTTDNVAGWNQMIVTIPPREMYTILKDKDIAIGILNWKYNGTTKSWTESFSNKIVVLNSRGWTWYAVGESLVNDDRPSLPAGLVYHPGWTEK